MNNASPNPGDSLLAVILVGKSSRGASVIYSYPPAPQPVIRTSKPIYPSHSHHTYHTSGYYSDSSDSFSSSSSDSLADSDDEQEASAAETYLGFPHPVLAALLCPKRELCDQPFELVVDHLAFVGHPVWLGDEEVIHRPDVVEEESEEDGQDELGRGRSRRRSSAGFYNNPRGLAPSQPVSRDATVVPSAGPSRTSSEPPTLSRRSSPSISPAIKFPRSPSATPSLQPHSSIASSQQSQTSFHGAGRLISFNFLCVIDTPPDSHLSSHLEGYYKDVVVPLTINIKALERKENWLGKEAAKIRKAREGYLEKGLSQIEQTSTLPSISSLSAALSQLYTSLKASLLANITIGTLPVQVLLRGELVIDDEDESTKLQAEEDLVAASKPNRMQATEDDSNDSKAKVGNEEPRSISPDGEREEGGGGVDCTGTRAAPLFSKMRRRLVVRYQPWETLLLLEDRDEMKRVVQKGGLLWRFLEEYNPTLSFNEYEVLLDADEDELRVSINHLVHWRKGRIIDTVSMKSPYVISSSFDISTLPSLTLKFRHLHPPLPHLPILLSHLRSNEPFLSLLPVPSLRPAYLTALKWLLQNEVVEKERTFIRVVISEEVKLNSATEWGRHNRRDREDSGTSGGGGGGGITDIGSAGVGSGMSDHSASGGGGGGVGSHHFGSLVRSHEKAFRRGSRHDFDDTRSMTIVGSALSNSPPPGALLSRSATSGGGAVLGKRSSHRSRTMSATTFSSASAGEGRLEETKGPSIIAEPGRPTALESRWLWEISREKEKGVVDKFERMIRMLNGSHHIEEIRYRANLTRKDIRLVLAAFSEHLIIFHHP